MEYNKKFFQKANDKKILHKVRKHWVVVSTALLMMLGGAGLATHVSAHADTGSGNNAGTLRERINQNLAQTHSQGQTSLNQNVHNQQISSTYNGRQTMTSNVSQQANLLHRRILKNAVSGSISDNNTNSIIPHRNANLTKEVPVHEPQVGSQPTGGMSNDLSDNNDPNHWTNVDPVDIPSNNVPINHNYDHSGINEQGTWGTASWTLYNDGLWYIHDGRITASPGGNNYTNDGRPSIRNDNNDSEPYAQTQAKISSAFLIKKMELHNVQQPNNVPDETKDLFDYMPNLVEMDFGNSYFTPDAHGMFNGDSSIRQLDLSHFGSFTCSDGGDFNGIHLQSIKFGPNTTLYGEHLVGNWVRPNGQPVNINGDPGPGIYYNTDNCVKATINFIFNGQVFTSFNGYLPPHVDATNLSTPNGYSLDPNGPQYWNIHSGSVINVPVSKMMNIDYYFGNHYVSSGQAYYDKYSDYSVKYNDLIGAPVGSYELDPRGGSQNINIKADGTTSDHIQVDKTGKWNQATWDLTPSGVDTPVTEKYGQGNLYIHDGAISDQENAAGNQSGIWKVSGLNQSDLNNLQSINFNNVSTPVESWNLFTYLPKLQSFSFKGLDTSQTRNFQGWFWNDPQLQKIDFTGLNMNRASDLRSFFWNDPALRSVDLSNFNSSQVNDESQMFGDDHLNKIIIGPNMIIYSNRGGDPQLSGTWARSDGTVVDLVNNRNDDGTYYRVSADQVNFHYEFSDRPDTDNVDTVKYPDTKTKLASELSGKITPGYYVDPSHPVKFDNKHDQLEVNLLPDAVWSGYKWGQADVYFDGRNDHAYVTGNGVVGNNSGSASQSFFDDVYRQNNDGLVADSNPMGQIATKLPNSNQDWTVEVLNAQTPQNGSRLFLGNSLGYVGQFDQIDLHGLDTSHSTELDCFLQSDYSVKKMNLQGLDVSRASDLGGMLQNDRKLQDVNLSGLNVDPTKNVNVTSMLRGNYTLHSINLSGINTGHFVDASDLLTSDNALDRIKISSDTAMKQYPNTPFFDGAQLFYSNGQPLSVNNLVNGRFNTECAVGTDPLGHNEYEIYAKRNFPIYFAVNNPSNNDYDTDHLINSSQSTSQVADPQGHQQADATDVSGNTSDGFVGYTGSKKVTASAPNGYYNAPNQDLKVQDGKVIDKLNGNTESGGLTKYVQSGTNNVLASDNSVTGTVGKIVNLKQPSQITKLAGYRLANPNEMKPIIHSGLYQNNTDNMLGSQNGNAHTGTLNHDHPFLVHMMPNLQTIPVIFYQNGNQDDVVNGNNSSTLTGNPGDSVDVYDNYVKNNLPEDYYVLSNNGRTVQDLQNYQVGTALSQDGLSGGDIDSAHQNNNTGTGQVKAIYIPVVERVTYDVPVTIKLIDADGHVQENESGQPRVNTIYMKMSGNVGDDVGFSTPTEDNYTLANSNNFKAKLGQGNHKWIWDTDAFGGQHAEAENASYVNGDNWDSTLNQPMLVFKAGDASKIDVHYINQNGQSVGPESDVISGAGRNGDHVNVQNPNKQSPKSFYGYPNPDSDDYTVKNDQVRSDYAFTNHVQDVTVPLVGKLNTKQSDGNNLVNVNLYTANSDGSNRQFCKTISIHLYGRIGSDVTVDPSTYLQDLPGNNPTSAYVMDPNDVHTTAKTYYLKGNQSDQNGSATLWNINNFGAPISTAEPSGTLNFTYDLNPNYNAKAQSITVNYVNQHKEPVGTTDTITPTASDYGQYINVTSSNSTLAHPNSKAASGEDVPTGYHLVDGPPVDYRISNQPQNVTFHVEGNPVQLNYNGNTLPVHVSATVYKSDGSTVDTGFNANGFSNGQLSKNTLQYPQLAGKVGDSRILSSADFQPAVDNHQIISSSDPDYKVTFTPQGFDVYNHNGQLVNHPSTAGIDFDYSIVENPQSRQRNYIHYVSYSDLDNRDDITTQPDHHAFPTEVSDASNSGSGFNDCVYRENVPQGYQFYKVYSVNSDGPVSGGLEQYGDGHGHPGQEYIEVIPNASPIHIHYINQNGSDVKDYTSDGISKNAFTSSVDSTGSGYQYTTKFGRTISKDQLNQQGQPSDQLGVPRGYQYAALKDSSNNDTTIGEDQPTFGRDVQDVYIPVVGKTYPKINVQFQQDLSNANNQHTSRQVSDQLQNAQVGHNYTIYGFDLGVPSAGDGSSYSLDRSDHPFRVTVHINPDDSYSFVNPNGQPSDQAETSSDGGGSVSNIGSDQISFDPSTGNPVTPPKASFWYHVANNVSSPLTLIYVNQAGQQVGCADKMQGTIGSDINVTDPSKGGEAVPSDYELDGGTNKGSDGHSNVLGNSQDTQYRFSDQAHTIYLHVNGKPLSPKLTVYTVARNSDGTTTFGHQTHEISGSDGSLAEVSPAEYNPDTSKYSIDYNRDSAQFVRIGRNQKGQAITTPGRLVFYYDSQKNNGAPIVLRYIDEKTGSQVGYTKVLNGNLNAKVAVAESDPSGTESADVAGEDVPAGYRIDTGSLSSENLVGGNGGRTEQPVYQFSRSPQMLNIPVLGDPKTLTYHIHVFKESPGGTIQGPASDVKLTISGRIGQEFNINPYDFRPSGIIQSISDSNHDNHYGLPTGGSGYHATNTDLDKNVRINSDGQLSPDGNTNYFYRQNYQSQGVGTVRIHYITGAVNKNTSFDSTGAPKTDAYQVDMVSDKGTAGTAGNSYKDAETFNLAPYRDDIPEALIAGGDYQSTGTAMDKAGNAITDNTWSYSVNDNGFNDQGNNQGVRDVYIQVEKRGANGNDDDNGPLIIGTNGQLDD